MYKKLLTICVGFSFLCHAAAEESVPSRWDTCIAYINKIKKVLGSCAAVALTGIGMSLSEAEKNRVYDIFYTKMQDGHTLNQAWVSLLKQRPDSDFAPLIQKIQDQIVIDAKNFENTSLNNLKEHMERFLSEAQKLPGHFLIEKAVNEDLPTCYTHSAISYLCGALFVGAVAYLAYEILQLIQQPEEVQAEQVTTASSAV